MHIMEAYRHKCHIIIVPRYVMDEIHFPPHIRYSSWCGGVGRMLVALTPSTNTFPSTIGMRLILFADIPYV